MKPKNDQHEFDISGDSTGGNSAGTEHHLPKKMKECTFTFMGCMPAQSLQENVSTAKKKRQEKNDEKEIRL